MQKTKTKISMRGNSERINNRAAGISQRKSERGANQDRIQQGYHSNKINPKDILRSEFIGLELEVIDSDNKKLLGIKGKITDETRNMLEINNQIKLIKNQITFTLKKDNIPYTIEGKQIVGRPEDRIKKTRKI